MKAVLLDSSEIAPGVRHFAFEVPELPHLDYRPGQFISLSATLGGRAITRAYSICSPPQANRFELCLNRVSAGLFSPHLFDLRPGDAVDAQGPLGFFTLRQPPADSLLVAAGTGIAPFRAMLGERLPADSAHRYTLVFGARYEHGLLYRGEFEQLALRHPHFAFWPTLSRPDPAWRGRTGHVQPHLREAAGDRRDLDVYVCGLKLMVDDVRAMLKAMGFDRRRVVYEKYD